MRCVSDSGDTWGRWTAGGLLQVVLLAVPWYPTLPDFVLQLQSTLRKCAGPRSFDASPPTSASLPASTVMRRATVLIAATSLVAVSWGQMRVALGGALFASLPSWPLFFPCLTPWSPSYSHFAPQTPHSCFGLPSASPGGDPTPGVHPGFPRPDGYLHLCGHRRPYPHHQLETQLGPYPLSSQV